MTSAASSRKAATNRRNASKSTGSKTSAGKSRAAGNAVSHGIFSQGLCVAGENPAEYAELLRALIEDLGLVGALEIIHVERIAMAVWRQRRLMRAESAAMAFRQQANDTRKMLTETLGLADSVKFKDRDLEPLSDEEMRHMGSMEAALHELQGLQDPPAHEDALRKAAPVYFSYLATEA